jgi:hypothetical protein
MKKLALGKLLLFAASLVLPAMRGSFAETNPMYYAVEVSATVQTAPAQIQLSWPSDPNATGYTVSRKTLTATSWTTLTSLPGTATSYSDGNVLMGGAYEYSLNKSTSVGYTGTGYIYVGINAPMIETRGKVLLIVDNTYAAQLATELSRLETDLIGDGWTVLRHDVSRSDTVANVKNIIKADYNADPVNVRTVFLFGHLPVPYSGNLNPDGHPDHQGAWPADAFYGDMNGTWTDSTVNTTSASRSANWNTPGDGKFDQSTLPSDVDLEVGRVDLANLTCFSNKTPARSELDLLRQYLNKDHNFRTGRLQVQRRGIVADYFGERSGEAFASSGWRNFAPFFGAVNVVGSAAFMSTLSTQDYLWAYGTGGGSYTTCNGIGGSDDFANYDFHAVFTMFLGSYFGDWDNESAFLRAPLGSTSYTLTAAWAGRPHWFFHHMGLGETIGYSTRLTQNNSKNLYKNQVNYSAGGTHVALMGDPTLRMHPVIPPSNLQAAVGTSVALTWAASSDSSIQGYYVYRASSPKGPFTRISGTTPIPTLAYTDLSTTGGQTYMVRAVKLERSGSGTYYNPSEGVFVTAGSGSTPTGTVPAAPSGLVATAVSCNQINLAWTDNSPNESGFIIYRKRGTADYLQIRTLGPNVHSYTSVSLSTNMQYYYKVVAFNTSGNSAFSNEAAAKTFPAPSTMTAIRYLGQNTTTSGNWKNAFGSQGYTVVGDSAKLPAFATTGQSGKADWTWNYSASATPALQKVSTADRIAACWYAGGSFNVSVNISDGLTHKVSFYCLDWDVAGRSERVDVLDGATGAVLGTTTLSNFQNGAYLSWDIKGNVTFRFTCLTGFNAVVSGLFFDAPSASL